MTGYYANSSSENILQLSEPEFYRGRVRSYSVGHGELVIDIGKSDERSYVFTLIMVGVEYIELPMGLLGLNLTTASEEDCWELLSKIGRLGSNPSNIEVEARESLREHYRLYQFRTLRGIYRVLAAHTVSNNPYNG